MTAARWRRPRRADGMGNLTVRLPPAMRDALEHVADRERSSLGEVIRRIVEGHFRRPDMDLDVDRIQPDTRGRDLVHVERCATPGR